jgi:SAM-dependent methyltransferase
MAKEAFRFSGDDALNYETYLGPILFEPSALEFLSYLGSSNIESVLEISSGTGRLTRHLRKYFPKRTKLVASDISPDMLEVAREQLNDSSIEFQVADAQQLPFSDGSFDLVLCQYGLMFLADKLKGFKEVFRVLKPGGRFIFATWDSSENIPLFNIIFNELVIPFFKGEDATRFRTPFSLHEPAKLIDFLRESNFTNNSVLPIKFNGNSSSPKNVVDALFLKHPLGREVADKDPTAVNSIAEEMERRLTRQFGEGEFLFDLKALIGIGQKQKSN